MADDWLGISSAEYDSHCGDDGSHTIEMALDGTDYWNHAVDEVHWVVLDLGQTYTIKKVRGRSATTDDPTDVNIYIDDSNPPTTLVHEGITTWQDCTTENWVEIDITDSNGRYIKIEIEATEDFFDYLGFGKPVFPTSWTIFDAYGDVAGSPPPSATPLVFGGSGKLNFSGGNRELQFMNV